MRPYSSRPARGLSVGLPDILSRHDRGAQRDRLIGAFAARRSFVVAAKREDDAGPLELVAQRRAGLPGLGAVLRLEGDVKIIGPDAFEQDVSGSVGSSVADFGEW